MHVFIFQKRNRFGAQRHHHPFEQSIITGKRLVTTLHIVMREIGILPHQPRKRRRQVNGQRRQHGSRHRTCPEKKQTRQYIFHRKLVKSEPADQKKRTLVFSPVYCGNTRNKAALAAAVFLSRARRFLRVRACKILLGALHEQRLTARNDIPSAAFRKAFRAHGRGTSKNFAASDKQITCTFRERLCLRGTQRWNVIEYHQCSFGVALTDKLVKRAFVECAQETQILAVQPKHVPKGKDQGGILSGKHRLAEARWRRQQAGVGASGKQLGNQKAA